MRLATLTLFALLLSGCAGGGYQTPAPTDTLPGTGGPTAPSSIATCEAAPTGTAHATPASNVATRTLTGEKMAITVAHRDSVARYNTDGSEEIAASPIVFLPLDFSPGLGYRFVNDGSAVYDQRGLHRLGPDLQRGASWNTTRLGGAIHAAPHYYAVADGKLHVLSEDLQLQHEAVIPNWTAPAEPRFDVLFVDMDLLLIGTSGRPTSLLVYQLMDRAKPTFFTSIEIPQTQVPIGDAGASASPSDPSARATPWTDSFFSHVVATNESILLWRDGLYQGKAHQTPSRFQDFVNVRRSNLTVQHLEQQYLDNNHDGLTSGAHVGPVDPRGEWALLHVEGTFSLSYLAHSGVRVFPACQVDVMMSSFAPEDAFLHRSGNKILLGTQARVDAWDVSGEPGKLAEAQLPKPATDARWT